MIIFAKIYKSLHYKDFILPNVHPAQDDELGISTIFSDRDDDRLLPFISEQKYNNAIKEIFRIAGVVRPVTVINPRTGKEGKRPICDVASSHLARRTFVGNLYKQAKDLNLVCSLSGHAPGSKAVARYYEVDEEMRRDLVAMLE